MGAGGVVYQKVEAAYFEQRGFRRYAGVLVLMGARRRRRHIGPLFRMESRARHRRMGRHGGGGHHHHDHVSRPRVLHRRDGSCASATAGAAYSFARSAMGPWVRFITGSLRERRIRSHAAVIVFFIGSYMGGIFETPAAFSPFGGS